MIIRREKKRDTSAFGSYLFFQFRFTSNDNKIKETADLVAVQGWVGEAGWAS